MSALIGKLTGPTSRRGFLRGIAVGAGAIAAVNPLLKGVALAAGPLDAPATAAAHAAVCTSTVNPCFWSCRTA